MEFIIANNPLLECFSWIFGKKSEIAEFINENGSQIIWKKFAIINFALIHFLNKVGEVNQF